MYVTFVHGDGQQRQKLVKLDDERTFTSITEKVLSKFSLPSGESQSEYFFQGKVETNGRFVEIDENDEDIMEDVIEIKFQSSQTAISPKPQKAIPK